MTTTPAALEPILVTREEAAKLCGVSVSTLDELRRLGEFPEPTLHKEDRRGRARLTRWARAVILDWVSKGCPKLGERPKAGRR